MFKKTFLIIFIGIVLLLTVSYFILRQDTQSPSSENQAVKLEQKTIRINNQVLIVEIADEPHEQAQGLSGRNSLGNDEGMLFIFANPQTPGFWMKEMNFSLDMLWIDADGIIVGIEKNVSPDTFPKTFSPPSPIKYVLEVNAGWTDSNKVKIGDVVKY